jgi:hypothetical protein
MSFELIDKKRVEILEKISKIRTMRKGVISEYFVNTKLKNGDIKPNGPYFSITSKGFKGKTIGEKIPKGMFDSIKSDVENYKLFRELSDEYIQVCEQASKQFASSTIESEKIKKNKKSKQKENQS